MFYYVVGFCNLLHVSARASLTLVAIAMRTGETVQAAYGVFSHKTHVGDIIACVR